MNNVVCDQDIAEEVFGQLGNVLAASTSLEEISLNVLAKHAVQITVTNCSYHRKMS